MQWTVADLQQLLPAVSDSVKKINSGDAKRKQHQLGDAGDGNIAAPAMF